MQQILQELPKGSSFFLHQEAFGMTTGL